MVFNLSLTGLSLHSQASSKFYVLELTMHAMMLLLHVLIHGLQFNSVRKFVGTSMVGICNISDLLFQV
jgi:hypothetical protein